jgi:FMN phosphatase YigB (HAD superfamily)
MALWSIAFLGSRPLASLVDGAVASAPARSAKPDGRIFACALELAGVRAHDLVGRR